MLTSCRKSTMICYWNTSGRRKKPKEKWSSWLRPIDSCVMSSKSKVMSTLLKWNRRKEEWQSLKKVWSSLAKLSERMLAPFSQSHRSATKSQKICSLLMTTRPSKMCCSSLKWECRDLWRSIRNHLRGRSTSRDYRKEPLQRRMRSWYCEKRWRGRITR